MASPFQRIRLRAAAVVAVAAGTSPALADDTIPVAVLPYAPLFGEFPQSVGDKTAEFIAGELGAGKQFTVAEVREPGARGKPKEKKAADDEIEAAKKEIAEAAEHFARAAQLAKTKKMKPAADAYEKGIQQFLLSFHGADGFQALSDAYLQLSIVRFKMGQEEEAYRLLEDLIRVDPSRVLKPDEVAPVFAKIHDKYRQAWLAKERGLVRVTSVPAGARVTFDGRELGETPLLARDVLPGEHFLRVVKAGQGAYWKKVKVVPLEELAIAADLAGEATGPLANIAKSLSANTLDEKTAQFVKEVGHASKAQIVVFGALQKSEEGIAIRSFALRVSDSKILPLADLSFDLEMVGAAIEVFKLASDLGEKAAEFAGDSPALPATPFEGVRQARERDQVAEVRITPSDGRAPSAPGEGGEAEGGRSGRRVVVATPAPATEKRVPAAAAAPEEKPIDEAPIASAALRRRGRIGEEPLPRRVEPPPEEKPAPRPEAKPEPPKDVLSEVVEEEQKPAEEKPADLKPKSAPPPGQSALSPEELAKLEHLDEGGSGRTGKVLLWTGVGVIGAAAVGTLVYFLVVPSTPTSAEAHITWTP